MFYVEVFCLLVAPSLSSIIHIEYTCILISKQILHVSLPLLLVLSEITVHFIRLSFWLVYQQPVIIIRNQEKLDEMDVLFV